MCYATSSDSCSWLLTAVSGTKVIQIETVDIEVQEHHGTCVDSIAAYDGRCLVNLYIAFFVLQLLVWRIEELLAFMRV